MKTNRYLVFNMDKDILRKDVERFARSFALYESFRDKTFLITGSTGLIGSVLIKCLVALNKRYNLEFHIVAVVRDKSKAERLFTEEKSNIDIRQLELNEISRESIGTRVDYIIHLASPTASKFFLEKPVETLQTIIGGTWSVLDYARQININGIVYASSLESYGVNDNDEWITEDFQGYIDPLEIRSAYSLGKRTAECLCKSYAEEYKIPIMIARLTQTFGAGISEGEQRVFAQFARKVVEKDDIELHTDGLSAKPYCYTTDAVSAILYLLIRGEKGKTYNVANKDTYISIHDMAEFVRTHFCPHISVRIVMKENQGYAPVTKLRLDTTKIENLGWHPQYDLQGMFSRLIAYLR